MEEEHPEISDKSQVSASEGQSEEESVITMIRDLREEAMQIADLREIEHSHAANVVSTLRKLIEPMGKSFHINPISLHRIDKNVTDVVLTPQGSICLVYGNGLIVTRSLENLSSESLVRVLDQVLPEIKVVLSDQRRKISLRTGLLEKVAGELKSLSDISNPHQRGSAKVDVSPMAPKQQVS